MPWIIEFQISGTTKYFFLSKTTRYVIKSQLKTFHWPHEHIFDRLFLIWKCPRVLYNQKFSKLPFIVCDHGKFYFCCSICTPNVIWRFRYWLLRSKFLSIPHKFEYLVFIVAFNVFIGDMCGVLVSLAILWIFFSGTLTWKLTHFPPGKNTFDNSIVFRCISHCRFWMQKACFLPFKRYPEHSEHDDTIK